MVHDPVKHFVEGMAKIFAESIDEFIVNVMEEIEMPLKKGKSNKVKEENFHELKKAHPSMPNKQRVAIVLSEAGEKKKRKNK